METHVLATFSRRPEADQVLDRLNERFPWAHARIGDEDDVLDAMALGQRAEVGEGISVPGGLMSGPFARGALLWGLLGLVGGALVALLVSLAFSAEGSSRGALVAFFALAGGIAASTVAAVIGAGRQAVKEGETTPEDPTAVVRASSDKAHADQLIEFLAAAGARSARFVDQEVPRRATDDVEAPRSLPDERLAAHEKASSDAGFRPEVGRDGTG